MILRFGFLFTFVILVLDEGTNVLNRLFSFELENIRWVAYLFLQKKVNVKIDTSNHVSDSSS